MANNIDDDTKTRLNYAWEWWKFHAKQRTDMFNFFLIVTGILATAYANAVKEDLGPFTTGIAVIGLAAAIGFLFLDRRNRYQLQKADKDLERIETTWLFTDNTYTKLAGIDVNTTEKGARSYEQHKFVFRAIEALVAIGWILVLAYSFLNLVRGGQIAQ
jgi:hypothetical protein